MGDQANDLGPVSREFLSKVLAAFVDSPERITSITGLGDGNINDTFLVTLKKTSSIVLQRINKAVFPNPEGIADNVALVTGHLRLKQQDSQVGQRTIRFPEIIGTLDGANWFKDQEENVWRCLTYIEGALSYPRIGKANHAIETGKLLGLFHSHLQDFDTSMLCEPLPGFHVLQNYKNSYLKSINNHQRRKSPEFNYCQKMIEERLVCDSLDELAAKNKTAQTVIHGDPKFDNFLFDEGSGEAVSLIDLDTVSRGLAAMDLGDCLRSLCNPAGEKGAGAEIFFNAEICRQLLEGYRQTALLNGGGKHLIYHGVRLLTYELGLRFFSDYLQGDRYFKVTSEEENLRRAWIQFTLLNSIEEQRTAIEAAAGIF